MARLKSISPALNSLAAKLTHERHQIEAREDTQKLRATLERLIARGIKPAQLLEALGQRSWESQIAQAMQAAGVPE